MEQTRARVLVVDDEANQRTALATMVAAWGYETLSAADGAEALALVEEFRPSVVVTDLMMPRMDGPELLRRLGEMENAPPAIMLTAFGNIETAIEMVHDLGAYWFLEKPLQPGVLRVLLKRAIQHGRLSAENERLGRQLSSQGVLGDMAGTSPGMKQAFTLINQVAPTLATVLITGESGTGKELAARAIHRLSSRASGPFLALNCAALPETLIESELFGHEKGSFTGAVERRIGCFELAAGGTLLLDEIGDMPMATQSKLLRVLEDRKVRRLGGSKEIAVDVRVLASTNADLRSALAEQRFREDLFYRLNVFQIHLPPLRERPGDLTTLCNAMLPELNTRHGCSVTGISAEAFRLLEQHEWPGNVRELRNALERAVILAGRGEILPIHLPPGTVSDSAPPAQAPALNSITLTVGSSVAQAERALIEATLAHTEGNRTRAAAILGISIKTLFNKLREYGTLSEE